MRLAMQLTLLFLIDGRLVHSDGHILRWAGQLRQHDVVDAFGDAVYNAGGDAVDNAVGDAVSDAVGDAVDKAVEC